MGAVVEYLKGKKTYFQAAAAGVIVILFALGLVEKELATVVLGVLGAGSVASLGAKIDRANSG